MSESDGAASPKTKVFISYSRRDRAFAEGLRDRLIGDGFNAYLDVHDIVKGEPWRERLQNLIFGADAVLFLISPDSISSKICDWELNEAERLAKRVLPVMCRSAADDEIPGRLKRLNFVSLEAEENWAHEYPKLCEALNRDILWLREDTRLSELAARWDRDGRPEAQLLRLDVVRNARQWEARRPADTVLSDVLVAFLEASEEKEAKDRERLLTITGRAFVGPAEQALTEGHFDRALRLAAAGTVLGEDEGMRLVPERARATLLAAASQPLRVLLRGHDGKLRSASYTRDGARIVTSSDDGTARVWDASDGRELLVLRGHEEALGNASFSDDGSRVLTSSPLDASVRVWDAGSGRELLRLEAQQGSLWTAAFSKDSKLIVAPSNAHTARVWDAITGREITVLEGHDANLRTAVFSEDGRRVLTAAYDGSVRVWRVSDGKLIHRFSGDDEYGRGNASTSADGRWAVTQTRTEGTTRVWDTKSCGLIATLTGSYSGLGEFDASGGLLASIAGDGCRIWNLGNGRFKLLQKEESFSCLSFNANGTRVVTGAYSGVVSVWDASSGHETLTLRGHESDVLSACFSPDGTRVLTASEDETARVWDSASDWGIAALRHADNVHSALYAPDGSKILTASADKSARLWDPRSGQEIARLNVHSDALRTAVFNRDGTRVLTHSYDGTAAVWNASDAKIICTIPAARGGYVGPRPAAISPDGRRAVTCLNDRTASVWDANTGGELAKLQGHQGHVWSASFSPDGSHIVTTGVDRTVRLWETENGHEIGALHSQPSDIGTASFSPDGLSILANMGDVRVWNPATGAELILLEGRDAVYSAEGSYILARQTDAVVIWDEFGNEVARVLGDNPAFSSDGALIATTSDDIVSIWQTCSGRKLAMLRGDGNLAMASFSPDGTRLLTAGESTAGIWDIGRVAALSGDVVVVLVASLSNNRGSKPSCERDDLLMRAAPEDLFQGLWARLDLAQRQAATRIAGFLSRKLHANCYLPPSQRPGWQSEGKAEQKNSDSPTLRAGDHETDKPIVVRRGVHPIAASLLFIAALGIGAGAALLLGTIRRLDGRLEWIKAILSH